jgi:uncharacterized protein (TIGR02646 family)
MRRLKPPRCPPALCGDDSPGERERRSAEAFFASPRRHRGRFSFTAYRHAAVRDALDAAFHRKCAYCESAYGATQPVDVEHYRPKGSVQSATGAALPGYWWLAATWDNLLPSCIDCNRRRSQTDMTGTRAVSGKGERFPLADERRRARGPGEEAHEQPLLLHPYRDDPGEHLEFMAEGVVRPALDARGADSRKGDATIDVVGLNRRGLVEHRRAQLLRVLAQLESVRRAERRLARDPDDAEALDDYEFEVSELRRLVEPDVPYSEMARQFIARARP